MSFAGRSWWVAVEDIGRLRDGVGVAVPVGVPATFTEAVADPLGELLGRYARTHGPFTTADAAARFGLGLRVAADVLGRLAADRKLTRGEFTDTATDLAGCRAVVRRRGAAHPAAPVAGRASCAGRTGGTPRPTPGSCPRGSSWARRRRPGSTGLAAVIDQLAGVAVPASAVEPLVFGQRVRDYTPAMLDELLASGEVIWSGMGPIAGGSSGSSDGWVAFHPADTAPLTLTPPTELDLTDTHRAILDALDNGGAYFFRQLEHRQRQRRNAQRGAVAADLVGPGDRGHVRAGACAAVGHPPAPARRAHRHRRAPRMSRYSVAHAQTRSADPTVAGRWSALPTAEPDSTVRAHFQADLLLGRHGVLTRGAVAAENVPGGFAMLYKVLTALEDAGRCQRGYFVESLGGAQFSTAGTVDRLRTYAGGIDRTTHGNAAETVAVVLAASDPANPYGAALPWPVRDADNAHRPGRKAGALVVLVDGELAWFVERGGRSLLSFTDDPQVNNAAAAALADLVTATPAGFAAGGTHRRCAGVGQPRLDRRRRTRCGRIRQDTPRLAAALTETGECPRATPSFARLRRCATRWSARR